MIIPWHQTQRLLTQGLPMQAIMITPYPAPVIWLVQARAHLMVLQLLQMTLHLLLDPILLERVQT